MTGCYYSSNKELSSTFLTPSRKKKKDSARIVPALLALNPEYCSVSVPPVKLFNTAQTFLSLLTETSVTSPWNTASVYLIVMHKKPRFFTLNVFLGIFEQETTLAKQPCIL
jgi:hypothetical protein